MSQHGSEADLTRGAQQYEFIRDMINGFSQDLQASQPIEEVLAEVAPELLENEHIMNAVNHLNQRLSDFNKTIEFSGKYTLADPFRCLLQQAGQDKSPATGARAQN